MTTPNTNEEIIRTSMLKNFLLRKEHSFLEVICMSMFAVILSAFWFTVLSKLV